MRQRDPVIDEIREVRHRISARFGHDPERLVAFYMELQEQYRDRLLDAPEPARANDLPAAQPVPAANQGRATISE
jgi:hypothetical protein